MSQRRALNLERAQLSVLLVLIPARRAPQLSHRPSPQRTLKSTPVQATSPSAAIDTVRRLGQPTPALSRSRTRKVTVTSALKSSSTDAADGQAWHPSLDAVNDSLRSAEARKSVSHKAALLSKFSMDAPPIAKPGPPTTLPAHSEHEPGSALSPRKPAQPHPKNRTDSSATKAALPRGHGRAPTLQVQLNAAVTVPTPGANRPVATTIEPAATEPESQPAARIISTTYPSPPPIENTHSLSVSPPPPPKPLTSSVLTVKPSTSMASFAASSAITKMLPPAPLATGVRQAAALPAAEEEWSGSRS